MKKIIKYTGLLLVTILILMSSYCIGVVYNAGQYTEKIISADLRKSQWRQPGGKARKFEMRSRDLSMRQKEILIKVQDPGFYGHNGVDLFTPGAGLTTITQAIVKKLYFENFKPGIAKINQTLIARFVVNDLISKDDQLTLFLNSMCFGRVDDRPIVGFESAADKYYHRPVKMLTEDQYMSLIAMLAAPEIFHILNHPDWNRDRKNRIKALVAGKYKPKGLMDQFYGDLPQEVINAGLPPASYFGDLYKRRGNND